MEFEIGEINFDDEINIGEIEIDYKTDTYTTEVVNVVPSQEPQTIFPTEADAISQVNVEAISDDYVKPSGTLEITKNGTYDVKEFLNAEVKTSGYDTSDATITENDVAKDKIAYGKNGKIVGKFEMAKMSLKYVGDGSQSNNFFELYADEDIQPYSFYTSNSTGWFRLSKVVTGDNCKVIYTKAFQNQKKCAEYDFTRGVTTLNGTSMASAFGTDVIVKLGTQCTEIGSQAMYDAPKYLYCYAVEPPMLASFNFSTKTNLVAIYVPDDSVDSYKKATNWTVVADYIKPLSEAEDI